MKKIKIWKNTSVLDQFNQGLYFTDDKLAADILLLGSRNIKIEEFTNLKAIFRAGVGTDNIPIKACENRNILLELPSQETRDVLYEETANFTISLMLKMLYPQPSISTPWKKTYRACLKNKNALIIGTGNIGTRVKNKLKLIMKVSTYDAINNRESELKSLIEDADIISLHIPSLPENINFIDSHKLKWMKKDAILINTARADIVNELSLYDELKQRRIRAAFDVFWEEPYVGNLKEFYPEPFYMTPHIASSCKEFFLGCRRDLDKMIEKL